MIASATPIPEAFCDKVGASGASSSSAGETTAPPSSTLSSVSSRLKPFRRIARALRMQGTSFSRSLCDAAMPATPRSRQTMPRTARNGDVSSSWNTSQPHRNDVTMPTPHQMPGPAAAPKYWIAGHANSCVRVKMSAPSAPKASPSLRNRGTSRPWPMQASEKLTKLVPRVTNPWTRKLLPSCFSTGCLAGILEAPNTSIAPTALRSPSASLLTDVRIARKRDRRDTKATPQATRDT
mmetsp:Transcript_14050/g.52708  ORF Transcript_14050/g.52708 Transcript_14050/m.52708 type:complete len:237 (-) Transcript_14050:74-784(-)